MIILLVLIISIILSMGGFVVIKYWGLIFGLLKKKVIIYKSYLSLYGYKAVKIQHIIEILEKDSSFKHPCIIPPNIAYADDRPGGHLLLRVVSKLDRPYGLTLSIEDREHVILKRYANIGHFFHKINNIDYPYLLKDIIVLETNDYVNIDLVNAAYMISKRAKKPVVLINTWTRLIAVYSSASGNQVVILTNYKNGELGPFDEVYKIIQAYRKGDD